MKRGLELSFAWLFAIIVGAVIIFLALYGTTQLADTERLISDSEAAAQLGTLLTPIETSLEDIRSPRPIQLKQPTRIFNGCSSEGNFGRQEISIAISSNIGEEWGEPGIPSIFFNKYIFSESTVESEEGVYLFSVASRMPFKIGSPVYLWDDREEYCFVTPPREIEDELESLNLPGVNTSLSVNACKEGSKKVCFESSVSACDISVSINNKRVNKDGTAIWYEDSFDNSFLYGAIFSDPGIYECQVKRLGKRTAEISLLYLEKAQVLGAKGCSMSNMEGDLLELADKAITINSSEELGEIGFLAKEIDRKNENLGCKLY